MNKVVPDPFSDTCRLVKAIGHFFLLKKRGVKGKKAGILAALNFFSGNGKLS